MPVNKLTGSQFRALGFLPLIFFVTQAIHYWRINELGNMLWMCNIGNLVLAIGMFLNHPLLIRVAVIWMVPGLVVWMIYVVLAYGVFLSSTLAHVGGILVGVVAIKRVGMDRRAWAYAFVWYLFIQVLSRLATSPVLNVNLAHSVEPGWRQAFNHYWKFWLVLSLVGVILLWIIGLGFHALWPARSDTGSTFSFRRKPRAR